MLMLMRTRYQGAVIQGRVLDVVELTVGGACGRG